MMRAGPWAMPQPSVWRQQALRKRRRRRCAAAGEKCIADAFGPLGHASAFRTETAVAAQAEADALRSKAAAAPPRALARQPSLPAPGAPTATLRLGSLSLGCHKIDWAAEESEAEEAAA